MVIFGSLGLLNKVKEESPHMQSFVTFLLEQDRREIKKGDTFYSIAKAQGISVDDITKANPNVDPTKLQLGQSINLPGSSKPKPENKSSFSAKYSENAKKVEARSIIYDEKKEKR